ncbi:unnamed protein product [Cyclocybe aegerita]|uniref:Uncharacterized protein n=1 Tax=Cyclocybe aegerita TaxID=1973307 RepID=A0A8S0VSK6_CYCAE|nr:unnamed protein product [Cyclocybe aegerita]
MSVLPSYSKGTEEIEERLVELWDEVQSPSFLYNASKNYIISNFGSNIPSSQKVQSFLNGKGLYSSNERKWTKLAGRGPGNNLKVEMQCILAKVVSKLGSRGMRVFSLLPFYQDITLETRVDVEETWSVQATPDLVVTAKGENFKSTRPGCEGDASLFASHIERAAGVVMVRTDQDFDSAPKKILLEAAYFAGRVNHQSSI